MKQTFNLTDTVTTEVEYPDDCDVIYHNILKMNEYDLPMDFQFRPSILDIGANVGMFAIWALKRWNPSIVCCYEPLKSNFEFLKKNIENIPETDTKFILENKAVEAPSNKLYVGRSNSGQASFYKTDCVDEDFEEVESVRAESLPDAFILKIDTEGCEKDILINYFRRKFTPALVIFEYHSDKDRRFLDDFMYYNHYRILCGRVYSYRWGLMKYLYNKIQITNEYIGDE